MGIEKTDATQEDMRLSSAAVRLLHKLTSDFGEALDDKAAKIAIEQNTKRITTAIVEQARAAVIKEMADAESQQATQPQ